MRVFDILMRGRTRRLIIYQGGECEDVAKSEVIRNSHRWLNSEGGCWEDISVTEGSSKKPYSLLGAYLPPIKNVIH